VHSLSTSFVLGYHGCDSEVAERLLCNEPFQPSTNEYDWLGPGAYFWESNPDRAAQWAVQLGEQKLRLTGKSVEPAVVGAVIDPGFCLDLMSSNGIKAVEEAFRDLQALMTASGVPMPQNRGGDDLLARNLDCAVIKFLHETREQAGEPPFDTVRGVFMEGARIYPHSGFRQQTHIQICVRNPRTIKGVFRVPASHFSIV
jgi:hypothetical protein